MDISNLLKDSDDSKFLEFIATQNEVRLSIYHDRLDKKIELKFPSTIYYTNFSQRSGGICYLTHNLISEVLNVDNGVYVPHQNFPTFMDEVRQGLHVLYGLRQSKYKFLFSCYGSFIFLIPFENIHDIQINILEDNEKK